MYQPALQHLKALAHEVGSHALVKTLLLLRLCPTAAARVRELLAGWLWVSEEELEAYSL
jgi:hypothetical protein